MKKVIKGLAATATTFAAVATLAACVPSSSSSAEKKLEKAGYEVTVMSGSALQTYGGVEGLDSIVIGMKDNDMIAVMYFTSKDAAKKYYDDTKDDASENEVVKHSGKIVYGGTETAVKDFD